MTRAFAILLTLLLTAPALAAPGDPRIVQGTLEWPATLTREPVIIVRGDDGHAYYCDVTEAARHGVNGLRAGGRVSVLGVEAAKPHELTGIVLGTGDAAALARALSQHLARQAAPPAAPSGAPAAAPEPPAAPAPAPAAAAAPAPAPSAPARSAAPAASAASAPSAAPASPAAPAPSAAPAVVIMAPTSTPMATAPAPAPTPAIVSATGTAPAVAASPAAARRAMVAAPRSGRGQWSRLDGSVESVAGSTLTLKTDDGSLAYVDISQLSPNVGQVLRQGTTVTVYGYPLEQRFEAAGYIQTHGGEPRAPATTTR